MVVPSSYCTKSFTAYEVLAAQVPLSTKSVIVVPPVVWRIAPLIFKLVPSHQIYLFVAPLPA